MDIVPFKTDYLPDMAALFAADFRDLRATVPVLPDTFADPAYVAERLEGFFNQFPGIVALDGGRVVGYLGWIEADDFRGAGRKGAYIPEWAHSATSDKNAVYRALLNDAASKWAAAGCGVYAISLLAQDRSLQDFWFWNGFGLIVVDGIRSIDPINAPPPDGITIRKASAADVPAITRLELDHAQYYREPPILMAAYDPTSADEIAAFISGADQAYWLALDGGDLIGMMRFEPHGDGAAAILDAPDKAALHRRVCPRDESQQGDGRGAARRGAEGLRGARFRSLLGRFRVVQSLCAGVLAQVFHAGAVVGGAGAGARTIVLTSPPTPLPRRGAKMGA